MRDQSQPTVLLVGNFLSGTIGTRGVCEELALRLGAVGGLTVLTTSARVGRLARLADMLGTIWRHRRAVTVAQVDVFSGPAFLWAEAACGLLRRVGVPVVLTLHGGNLPVFAKTRAARVRRLLGAAEMVTVPSRYLLEQMAAYRSDLRLLPNPLARGAYRFRLRKNPQPVLVWLRAFHEVYNPTLVPRVVQALAAEFPAVRAIMLGHDKGDGSLAKTQQLAAELGVAERLEFPGRVPKTEVPVWLDKGDIFLNTANIDNAPVSVLEALAAGLCVVSTSVGGMPYLLNEGRDGLLVPVNDPAAMAAAVRRILVEPELGERLSDGGRRTAEACDWAVVLPQWLQLLRGVARQGSEWPELSPAATKENVHA